MRLRRDLALEATDMVDPELATSSFYAGRFLLPGFGAKQIKNTLAYTTTDSGEGMYTGEWYAMSPLTIDYDYFMLFTNTVNLLSNSSIESEKAIRWWVSQVSPIYQAPLQLMTGESNFFGKPLTEQDINFNILQLDAHFGGLMFSYNNDDYGLIDVEFKTADKYLEAARKSRLSQFSYLKRGKGVPYTQYGHFAPKTKTDAFKFSVMNDIFFPGVVGSIPVANLAFATKFGRVGNFTREMNHHDLGLYVLGKEASNRLVEAAVRGMSLGIKGAKTFDQILKETENMNRDDAKNYVVAHLIDADKRYLESRGYPMEGDEEAITEREAGLFYDIYIKPPGIPSEVGVFRLFNIQGVPSKLQKHAVDLVLMDLKRKIDELD
jgi:hypothetical protein